MIPIHVTHAYLHEKLFLLPGNKSHPASIKPQFSEGEHCLKYAIKNVIPESTSLSSVELWYVENIYVCVGQTVVLMA